MKERHICAGCGFDIITIKHHPSGREERYFGESVEYSALSVFQFRRVPLKPDEFEYLCPNCHALLHWRNKTISQAGKIIKNYWGQRIRQNRHTQSEKMWNTLKYKVIRELSSPDVSMKYILKLIQKIENGELEITYR